MAKMWLIFLSFTIARTTEASYWPENTVVLIGDTLIMKCGVYANETQSNPLNWKFSPVGSKLENERFVYSDGAIGKQFQQFTINQTEAGFQYDLTTASAKLSDAGSYRCTKYQPVPDILDSVQPVVFEAQVIVLASNPACATNISRRDDTIEERNWLELSCKIYYRGNWPPDLEWSQAGKRRDPSIVNEITSVQHFPNQGSRFTSIVAIDSSDHGSSFMATVFFSLKNLNLSTNKATNVPRYEFKWTSNATNVLYGARNATVSPPGSVFKPGDSLACRADGNPEPTYQWTELSGSNDNSILLIQGSVLNVSRRMVQEELYTFQCTATNEIDAKKYSATVTIAFNVREIGFSIVYWIFTGFGAAFVFLLLILTSTCTYIVVKRKSRKAETMELDKDKSVTTHFPMEDRFDAYEEIEETTSNVPSIGSEPSYIRQELVFREENDENEQENESNNYEHIMANIRQQAEQPSVYTPVFLNSQLENPNKSLHKQEATDYLELLE